MLHHPHNLQRTGGPTDEGHVHRNRCLGALGACRSYLRGRPCLIEDNLYISVMIGIEDISDDINDDNSEYIE